MSASRRDNARGQAGVIGKANDDYQRSHSSTSGEAQRQRIVEMLRPGQKHTLDFRRAGIMQSQTRIFELRAQGYPHRGVAVYALVAEAVQEVAP